MKKSKLTSQSIILSVMLALLLTTILARPTVVSGVPDGGAQQIKPGQIPNGLSATSWDSIQAEIAASKYRAYADNNGGYLSSNAVHGWQITYGANGVTTLTPSDQEAALWHWGLQLTGYGYSSESRKPRNLQELEKPKRLTGNDHILIYQWNDNLSERWVNTPAGLEQVFTLQNRPGEANNQPLILEMNVTGNLNPVQFGQAIAFLDETGATAFTYDKLRVTDVDDQIIPAQILLGDSAIYIQVEDDRASYPLTIDPLLQQAYLKASNAEASDYFAVAVDVSGDTVVVGAFQEDSNATGVNGNQANNLASNAGAAYIFTRSGNTWSQQAYLKASNTGANDYFGYAVAISGDTVVVGAYGEASNATGVNGNQVDNSAAQAGAAYIFTRSGNTWSQQAYLKASNTASGDRFGHAISISNDTVVVGAYAEASNATGVNGNQTDNSANGAGAAYVFTRSGETWSQQAYLKASNTERIDFFGFAVDISSDTIVVGAYAEDSNAIGVDGEQTNNAASNAGAAYVFVRNGEIWSQQAYLKASNTGANDNFGYAVAVSGDTVVVGANAEDSNATGVNGNQANNSANNAGAAYIFIRTADTWSQQAYLKASNTGANDYFGYAVAVSGDTAIVGAYGEASNATGVNGNQVDNSAFQSGAAYVFTHDGETWSQQSYLKASNTGAGDRFGFAVAINGEVVVVGAYGEASNATGVNSDQANNSASFAGASYVFDRCIVSAQTGFWDDASTWEGGAVPGNTDSICVLNGHTITLDAAVAVDWLWITPGGVLDLASFDFTVENGIINDGTIRQMRTVDNASIEFLHIQNAVATVTQYRGVLVDAAINNQNLGEVIVSIRELNSGEYCTNDGDDSPAYATRCYEIMPTIQPEADVRLRLYARTADELNNIAAGNLVAFRYMEPGLGWAELITNRSVGNDGGFYSYAEGDTPGFSAFLLGQLSFSPTIITLSSISASNQTARSNTLIYSMLSLWVLLLVLWLCHKYRHFELG